MNQLPTARDAQLNLHYWQSVAAHARSEPDASPQWLAFCLTEVSRARGDLIKSLRQEWAERVPTVHQTEEF